MHCRRSTTFNDVGKFPQDFSPVVFFLYEVVASAEGDQVCIVGGRRYRHTARAPDIGVTQLVRQHLKVIGGEVVVVPQDVVV